ncbi:MAG: restriction endonuclease subunit S [Lactococcus cremoris]|uniref:restriction endonuclease subunit S n=1 Tax=Lactococcus lactis TaxID=1358 RepID=UPI0021AFD6D7|nr:restriction endonuclease subunit S [Lactococcus lactis]MCT0035698.1 restriction endonuclease subunit S [Lactococcus lactis subsp. lactis]
MKERLKAPELRFPGFTDDWVQRKLGDLIEEKWIVRQSDGNHGNLYPRSEEFVDSGVPYVAASNISSDGNSIDFSTVKYLPQRRADLFKKGVAFDGDILLAHNATVGPVLRLHTSFDKVILSTTLTLYRVDSEKIDPDFFLQNLRSSMFQNQLFETMKQSTRNQVPILAQQKLSISITSNLDEQERIGKLLTLLDDLIATNQRKLDLLKEQKKGYLQKMFPKNGEKVPELRFAGFADDWEERKFKDILKTHSFRSYLAGVSENGEYEVIQQGDKPIVGYSDGEPFTDYKDITLFGDHTVSLYKPKSPFFVATDGVKILSADNFDGDYLYTTLERYKPEPQGYKRHFTILKNQDVWFTENMEEQQKIGSFFKQLDDTIALHQRKLDLLKEQKKGFLQKMFV